MVVDVVVRNPQKSNEYEYEKKHVRRDSKMCCCCCCRFCCGASTTNERIHAPVLHDASQVAYCRYWGRASLPPITSTIITHDISGMNKSLPHYVKGCVFIRATSTSMCILRVERYIYHLIRSIRFPLFFHHININITEIQPLWSQTYTLHVGQFGSR